MENNEKIQRSIVKKPFRKKYIFAAAVLILLLSAALVFIYLTQELKPDPNSEIVIRKAAASQYHKNPNELTDEDFVKMKHFTLWNSELGVWQSKRIEISDIKLLEKFTNLQVLQLNNLLYPESAIPKWMKILERLGIYDLNERFTLDLSLLEKLSNLQVLHLGGASIKNIKPLAGLTNLKQLVLIETQVSDLEPIKGLINLQLLVLENSENITKEQIKELHKALPNLKIER